MAYTDVLRHLKEFKIDRIVLSDFTETWTEVGSVNVTSCLDHTTVYPGSVKVETMDEGDYIYLPYTTPLRLDDRNTITIHLWSDTDLSEGDLQFILSDSDNLSTSLETIDFPDVDKETMTPTTLTITNPQTLSNVRSVGLLAAEDLTTTTFYLALLNAGATDYITTIEDVEAKEAEGELYVLSKLGPDYTTLPDSSLLDEAVSLAGAGLLWLRQKENENYQYDYGTAATTKNYGNKLLAQSRLLVESYIAGGDAEDGTSTAIENVTAATSIMFPQYEE